MKRKIVLGIFLAVMLTVFFAAFTISQFVTAAPSDSWSEINTEPEYDFGMIFKIPERTVTVGGESAKAHAMLIYPDGSGVDTAEAALSQSGVYKLKYTAKIGDSVYESSVEFLVKEPYYSFTSNKSSAVWGTYQYAKKSGLMVRLADGDTMRFNEAIDLSEVTINDIIVEAFVTPDMKGAADFKQILFTFTDIENPEITMTISGRASSEGDGYPISYFLAAGNGQLLSGWEAAWNRLHINNEWGQQIPHSFTLAYDDRFASYAALGPDANPIRLSYDPETLQAYVGGLMIIDFDNPAYFTDLWSGFPSGKVYMSVSAGSYIGETANFCITNVRGLDLEKTLYEDKEGPIITVDSEYENLPDGKVGISYPVAGATADDFYCGIADVKTRVYYNYGASNEVMVRIDDGKFIPSSIGRYAIVYEAADKFGNISRIVNFINVKNDIPKPSINITGTKITDIKAGEFLMPTDYTASCENGKVTVKITATLGDKIIEIGESGVRIDEAGTYTVSYTATDYVGQTSIESYALKVTIPEAPIFVDTPNFPKYLICGSSYQLPELYVNDYSSGKLERKLSGAVLTDDNGNTDIAAGGSFVPTVLTNGNTVTITYKCDGAEYKVEIPVIIAWIVENGRPRLQIQNYFCAENGQITLDKKTNGITVTALNANSGWTFANSFVAEQFELSLRGIANVDNYDAIRVVMTDANDPALAVEARLIHNGKKNAQLQLGDMIVGMDDPIVSDTPVGIGYKAGKLVIGTSGLDIKTYANGDKFEGFPSGRLYISVYFENAASGAGYDVVAVNGHAMNNLTSDKTGPKIGVDGDYGGSYKVGDIATIPMAFACDTMDPNCTITLTVRDADGNIATDINGKSLSEVSTNVAYQVKLESFGQYIVELTAKDTFNKNANTTMMRYALNVDDNVAPIIEFKYDFKTEAKVGDVIVIPTFTVSDNITAAENIIVKKYYVSSTGVMYPITGNSNSVKMTTEGIYEFRIVAVDENGNMQMARAYVTVTGEEAAQ